VSKSTIFLLRKKTLIMCLESNPFLGAEVVEKQANIGLYVFNGCLP